MKIQINEDFDRKNLLAHLKHIDQYYNDPRFDDISEELKNVMSEYAKRYNQIANELAQSEAGVSDDKNSNIVGFVKKEPSNRAVKYNQKTRDLVIYDYLTQKRTNIVTLYKLNSWEDYLKFRKREIGEELPENKEK